MFLKCSELCRFVHATNAFLHTGEHTVRVDGAGAGGGSHESVLEATLAEHVLERQQNRRVLDGGAHNVRQHRSGRHGVRGAAKRLARYIFWIALGEIFRGHMKDCVVRFGATRCKHDFWILDIGILMRKRKVNLSITRSKTRYRGVKHLSCQQPETWPFQSTL